MPKKPKKILIFEGDKVNAANFLKFCQNKDYVCTIVSDEITSSDFLDTIEKKVKEEEPDYVIISNVRGKNLEVAEKAKEAGIGKGDIIIYANPQIAKRAKNAEYVAFRAPTSAEKIFEYIDKH